MPYIFDDPERGYVDALDTITCECGDSDCTGRIDIFEGFHVTVADCSLCGREVPGFAPNPLCRTCEATCKAYARLARDEAEWLEDRVR